VSIGIAVLLASGLCYAIKMAGYLLPHEWLEHPEISRLAARITVAMLAALVAVQLLGQGRTLTVDERVPAVAVAAVLLWRRAPFVVVVISAAVVAALLRML